MKKPIKKRTKHQLWAWGSLTLNLLIATALYASHIREEKMLMLGCALTFTTALHGAILAWRDSDKKDGIGKVVLDYACVLALSLMAMYEVCDKTTLLAFWCMAPAMLLEAVGVFVIARKK